MKDKICSSANSNINLQIQTVRLAFRTLLDNTTSPINVVTETHSPMATFRLQLARSLRSEWGLTVTTHDDLEFLQHSIMLRGQRMLRAEIGHILPSLTVSEYRSKGRLQKTPGPLDHQLALAVPSPNPNGMIGCVLGFAWSAAQKGIFGTTVPRSVTTVQLP